MTSVTLTFPVVRSNDQTGFTYVDYPNLSASVYASKSAAPAKLRELVAAKINHALEHVENWQQRIIGCADGTVLLIQYKYGWSYSIAGPGRQYACACQGGQSFNDILASARKHAETFGGISWEVAS